MSFHLRDMATLRKALKHLKSIEAELEDPGDEIGPEAPDSPHMGLWVHDPGLPLGVFRADQRRIIDRNLIREERTRRRWQKRCGYPP